MPFENVHGNGGLLTTAGDLLVWSQVFVMPPPEWVAIVRDMQTPARLADGRALHYGMGLFVGGRYKGVDEVYHSGATAGYRAFLTRFPEARVSVAVLCTAGTANATALAHAVSEIYLGDRLVAGAAGVPLLTEARGPLVGVTADRSVTLSAADLAGYAGDYASDEIETVLRVEVRGDGLVIARRPSQVITLRPHSRDRFEAAGLGLVTFHREGERVVSFGVTQDRVWDLRFVRTGAPSRVGQARPSRPLMSERFLPITRFLPLRFAS
jgi:hypothetical protein